jgi:hypothetical protein
MLMTVLPSHVSDVTAESYWWCRCRVMLATALLRQLSCGVMLMLSHAGDDAAEATWPQRDVDAESYRRQCCRVLLATTLLRPLGRGVILMLSHAGNGVVEMNWPQRDVDAESCWWQCWRWCYQGDLAVARYRCRVMLAIMLPSHARDGDAEVTWPRHDINVEPYWQQCCRVMLTMALPRWPDHDTM